MPLNTQTDFTAGLVTGGAVPPGVVDPGGKAAPKRYGVYQNNVVVSLIEALKATFPAVEALIGSDVFSQMARAFITHSQPQSPILAEYGRELPEFLRLSEPLQHMPYLADVARLELAWLEAYHAEDAVPLAPDALAGMDDEALIASSFAHHPALRIIESDYAVFDLWRAARTGQLIDQSNVEKAQGALITRPDVDVMVAPLSPAQIVFFETLGTGAILGEAVEKAMAAGAFDLPASLQLMLSSGALMSA